MTPVDSIVSLANYTVAKVKTFQGEEGLGYNTDLLRDGKKVALVIDSATGGPVKFYWVDYAKPRTKVTVWDYAQDLEHRLGTPEEALFAAAVQQLPGHQTLDQVIEELVNDGFLLKALRGKMKKTIQMIEAGSLFGLKMKPGLTVDQMIDGVRKRYPAALILNNLDDAAVLAAYKKVAKQ